MALKHDVVHGRLNVDTSFYATMAAYGVCSARVTGSLSPV